MRFISLSHKGTFLRLEILRWRWWARVERCGMQTSLGGSRKLAHLLPRIMIGSPQRDNRGQAALLTEQSISLARIADSPAGRLWMENDFTIGVINGFERFERFAVDGEFRQSDRGASGVRIARGRFARSTRHRLDSVLQRLPVMPVPRRACAERKAAATGRKTVASEKMLSMQSPVAEKNEERASVGRGWRTERVGGNELVIFGNRDVDGEEAADIIRWRPIARSIRERTRSAR